MSKVITSFEDFKINRQILNAIDDLGHKKPTDIQKKSIPIALNGQDILGIAQTGTGKTAAFVIPLIMKLKYAQGELPRALILSPTRELATQTADNFRKLSAYTDLRVVELYGGVGPKTQIENLEKGSDVIVATPGRFMDVYLAEKLVTKLVQTLVIDEADKMMDMGFMPQIRRILEVIPVKKRQNLLFSATIPEKVIELSHEFLEFPVKIEISPSATAAETVEQRLYSVPNLRSKISLLNHLLLNSDDLKRVIVFTRTKKNADNVFKYLDRKLEDEVRVIHGNKAQNTRLNSIDAFKQGEVRILVATDVVARGIDVSDVSHVINFDVPIIYEDYVHRIGRTGRAFNKGIAITFMAKSEEYHIEKIEKLIQSKIPLLSVPEEIEMYKTEKWEHIEMAREIDRQKRWENPDFKGAFHEKKDRKSKGDKKRNPKKRR
ncbi:MAG: DEAD/DEAH box helicase [Bacteroidota bacterium]